jgi:PAS domain S-box-containing protein
MKNAAQKAKPASAYESSRAKTTSIWDRFLEPSASIREPERRRRARLLSALLATQLLLVSLVTFLVLFIVHQPSDLYIILVSAFILAVAYCLSRTQHYNLAALLAIGTLSGSVFASQFFNPDPSSLYFLILGVLVSSLFLSRRDTMLIMAATILGIGLLRVFLPVLSERDIIGAMFAVFCVGVLGIVAITIRQQDLQQIQEQARLLVEDGIRQKQAEVVQLSEKRFRSLIENSTDAIALLDADGIAVYDSPSAPGMLGYGPEEWIGKNVFKLIHANDFQKVNDLFQNLARTPGARVNSIFRLRHKNGSWLWIEAVATNLFAEPSVKAIVINYRDITERKQTEESLRESEEKYRTLVEKMNEGLIVVDNNDVIQFVNNRFTQLVGYAREELLGSVAYNLFVQEEDQDLVKEKNELRLEQKSDEYELRMKTKSGEIIWVRVSGTPVLDNQGNVVGSIGINTDITQHKQAEEELKRRLADFEAVNQLSSAMRQAQALNELLPIILDVTLRLLHAPAGSIWLYDSIRDELRAAVTRGYNDPNRKSPYPPEKPGEGIAGHVFATRQPFIEKDFHLSPRLPEAVRQQISPGIGGASVPLRAADNVIGTFNISIPRPRELTSNEIHLLTTLSEIAGNAIQRMTLHQQTARRLQNLSALSEIDRSIISNLDLRITLGTLLNHVIAQLDIDAADVLLFDSNSLMLKRIAEHGFVHTSTIHEQPRLDNGFAGQAILDGRKVKIENINEQKKDEFLAIIGAQEGFVSYYAVPLMAKGYTKGVLEIFKRAPLEPDTEWLDFLDILAGQAAIAIDNVTLFDSLQRSNSELSLAYDATIEGWSHALDLRDRETEGHTQRVTEITIKLAQAFGLSQAELTQVRWGTLLHDIGKMGVPDAILLKPGPLTDEEWIVMRKHPTFAYEMLSPVQYLSSALDIPYCHHEKWDGTGYPRGLKGEQIPLTARIFAVVDVWDALRSDRPYRASWPKEKVRKHIKALAGTHFDPHVVKVFLESDIFASRERKSRQ